LKHKIKICIKWGENFAAERWFELVWIFQMMLVWGFVKRIFPGRLVFRARKKNVKMFVVSFPYKKNFGVYILLYHYWLSSHTA
jgi:hypothetical protein